MLNFRKRQKLAKSLGLMILDKAVNTQFTNNIIAYLFTLHACDICQYLIHHVFCTISPNISLANILPYAVVDLNVPVVQNGSCNLLRILCFCFTIFQLLIL